jgi:dihydrolipoamide dehydrogenase
MVVGELTTKVDVAVIGSGPGGYTAAIRCAQLGLETVLIEKGMLGGVCMNIGCIPSKSLLHAAAISHEAGCSDAKDMGIDARISVDFRKMQSWKDGVVNSLRDGISQLLRLNGVELVAGRAFFTSSTSLSVETESGLRDIEFRKAIIATGTVVKELPSIKADHRRILTSDDVFSMQEIPERLLVAGGGYIGVEMASLFSKLGSQVTISYRGERLLRNMEPELTDVLAKKMEKDGIVLMPKSDVLSVSGETALLKTQDGEKQVAFDIFLMATGRVTDLESLGLDKTQVRLNEEGLVIVDEACRTLDEGIYAIGDVTPGPQLAHKAFRQAKVAAECIAGQRSAFDNRVIPMVVFSDPEIASVGLTEEQAKAHGHQVVVGKMPLTAIGRAKCLGKTDGFIKIVADRNGFILGAHMVGVEAGDIIAEAALAMEMAAQLEDIACTIHTHPTMPEALMEAAEDALGKAIHLYRGKRK